MSSLFSWRLLGLASSAGICAAVAQPRPAKDSFCQAADVSLGIGPIPGAELRLVQVVFRCTSAPTVIISFHHLQSSVIRELCSVGFCELSVIRLPVATRRIDNNPDFIVMPRTTHAQIHKILSSPVSFPSQVLGCRLTLNRPYQGLGSPE
jgi:hypothetical protein